MKIHDVKQGSPEWLAARAGIFTASEFDQLISPTLKKRDGQMPQTYMLRKIAERCMGMPLEQPGTWAMDQGTFLEAEAIPWLEFAHNVVVQRVGFVTTDDGQLGCSPDGLIGDDGGVEIKSPQPVAHIRYLLDGGLPPDYFLQVHGSMLVTGRKWWDFVSYSRHFPSLRVRVNRDDKIIEQMDAILRSALDEYQAKLARILAMKEAHDAPIRAAHLRQQAADEEKARRENGGELPGDKWLREQEEAKRRSASDHHRDADQYD